jgi:hypothetical protein
MMPPTDFDIELANRLVREIMRTIVRECSQSSAVPGATLLPFPEVADALLNVLTSLASELPLFNNDQHAVHAFAEGIATRVRRYVPRGKTKDEASTALN